MEFEWKLFPGFTTFGLLEQIQEFMKERQCDQEQFKGRIIFMSVFNDFFGEIKKMQRNVKVILTKLRIMLSDFLAVIGHSWDLDQKRNGTELILMSLMEFGIKAAEVELAETIHPLFRASSVLERGELRSKGGSKKTIHFYGSEQNVEVILRTIISAKQLSIYGAVADMCGEVSKDTMALEKLEAHDPL